MSLEFLDFVKDIIDLQIVWDVVKQDIPGIKPQIRQVLADYSA